MPLFQNPTDASGEMTDAVNSKTLSPPNVHFPIPHDDGESNLNSFDGAGTNKKRAFERILTYPQSPMIGRERAISVMAIKDDGHHKNLKILPESALKCTPEGANLPLCTYLTTLPTTSAELYKRFFRTSPEHVITFFNHHIEAVIRNGTLIVPGTPPGTNSRHPATLLTPFTWMRTPSSMVPSPTAPP
jgi:hypothetical protein